MVKSLLVLLLSFLMMTSYAQDTKKTQTNPSNLSVSGTIDQTTIHRIGTPTDNIFAYVNVDFEDVTFPPTGWTLEYTGTLYWTRETTASGYGIGTAAAKFNFYSASNGVTQSLISGTMTPTVAGDSVKFDEAYASYSGENDQMSISTSANGGTTWTQLVLLNGGASGELVTAPPQTATFTPTATQWQTLKYALPVGTNMVKFTAISAFGNNLWVDNIKIGTAPANDAGTVSIDLASSLIAGVVSPKATFKNFGSATIATMPVTFKVGTYTSTKTVTSLAPNATIQVTFDNWNATAGSFTMKAYSSLAGDANAFNDTVTKAVTVVVGIPNYSGWINLPPLSAGRWAYASAYVRKGTAPNDTGFVYVISGADATMNLTTDVQRLNLRTNTWQTMAPIPVALYQVSAAAIGSKIYVPGGYSGGQTGVNTMYIYDCNANSWTTGATMTQAVGDYAIGTYNGKVYVFEGRNSPTSYNLVQVYDPVANTWSSTTPVPGPALAGIRGSIAGNTVILTGGYDNVAAGTVALASKGVINGDGTITWSTVADYPAGTISRHSAGTPFIYTQATSRYVLFTGGDPTGAGTTVSGATYAWDTQTNQWFFAGVKPTPTNNLDNFVGMMRNDSLYMASFGGYNGTSVTAVAEALGIGLESQLNVVPVELTSFTADVNGNEVSIRWMTATETNNRGFSLVRKSGNGSFEEIAFIAGKGTTVLPSTYSFTDRPSKSGKYTYALRQVDLDGTSTLSNSVEVDFNTVNTYSLEQNYPNPFNPSTLIKFSLAVDSKVSLKIFNILGQEVFSNIQNMSAGSHSVNFNASALGSGVYLYKLEAKGSDGREFSSVKKMSLLK